MNADDRARLRQILASFDEAGLVALANKGLVRRAQKDLEAGGLTLEETDTAVLVRGPGWVVTMPSEGPAHATDTTKATGVTRQILTATIYLRDALVGTAAAAAQVPEPTAPTPTQEPPSADAAALREALLALTLDDLQKWAGKTVVREALAAVRGGMDLEVAEHVGLTLRLVRHEVEARLQPARGKRSARALLDEALTTAPRALHKRWVAIAVLAFLQSHSRLPEEAAPQAPQEEAGAPRTRQQILAATRELLEGMVTTGLAHPSARMEERLFTLSVSAVAVHLPRLARLLRALADDVERVLTRDAAADTARLFDRVALTHALTRALDAAGPQAPVALAGQHRTQYDPAGDLQLAGVGAHPWQTASGYEGLTVLLWDLTGRRFLTWTASRPVGSPGPFDPAQSYRTETPWSGSGSPERFSRSRFTLRQVRVNPQGRLSGAEGSSVTDPAPTDPAQLDFGGRAFRSWPALVNYALAQYPIGLTEKNPLDRLVVLHPTGWGERSFDELQQRFCWPVQDDTGHTVVLTLPWAGVNETSIEFLEAVNPERDALSGVLCRLTFNGKGLRIEPLTLFSRGTPQGHQVLNPAFDRSLITSRQSALLNRLREKYGRGRVTTVMSADDEEDVSDGGPGLAETAPPGIRSRLAEVERWLLQVAEAGLGRLDEMARDRLRRLAAELDRAGLRELGQGIGGLGQHAVTAATVIGTGYLCRLHREALRLVLSRQLGQGSIP
jgi:hypothetical protein